MLAENKFRHRILELQEYRRNGCITMEQGAKYDRDKAARVSVFKIESDDSKTLCATVHNYSPQLYLHDIPVRCNVLLPQPV
jgi:hypothetical protein